VASFAPASRARRGDLDLRKWAGGEKNRSLGGGNRGEAELSALPKRTILTKGERGVAWTLGRKKTLRRGRGGGASFEDLFLEEYYEV